MGNRALNLLDASWLLVESRDTPMHVGALMPFSLPPNAGPDFVAYTSPVDFMIQSNGLSAIGPPWSQLTAYDLNRGHVIQFDSDWDSFIPYPGLGGDGSWVGKAFRVTNLKRYRGLMPRYGVVCEEV